MRLHKLVMTGLIACTLSAGLVGGPVAANAATPPTSTSAAPASVTIDQYVEAKFAKFGVAESARPGLRAKIARGELPDSDKGSTQVAQTQTLVDGVPATRSVYADGSVSISSFADNPNLISTAASGSLSKCSSTSQDGAQTYRTNCQASYDALTWSGSYFLKTVSWGTYGYVTGPFGKVAGGVGIQSSKVEVFDGGGTGKTAWVRMTLSQKATVKGVEGYRDVGFDLKLRTGPSFSSFGG